MFFVRFLMVFMLFLSLTRIALEAIRLTMCLINERHFETSAVGTVVTMASIAYVLSLIVEGLPAL